MKSRGWVKVVLLTFLGAVVPSSSVLASIQQQFFVSRNNKLYYVVTADPTSGIGAQVTSLIISSGSTFPLNETFNPNLPDNIVTAVSAALTGFILPDGNLANIKRTAILSGFAGVGNDIVVDGNPADGDFDPDANGGDGLLTLPGGILTVAFGAGGTVPLTDLTQTTGAGSSLVPAGASLLVSRRIGGGTFLDSLTIVFPNPPGAPVLSFGASCSGCAVGTRVCDPANANPADNDDPFCNMGGACGGNDDCGNLGGENPAQNVSLDETLETRVGSGVGPQASAIDGFLLRNSDDIIVFVVDDGAPAFGLSASGFSVTGTCAGGTNAGQPCTPEGAATCIGGGNGGLACAVDEDCPDSSCNCAGGGTCGTALDARIVLDTTGDVDNQQFNTPTVTPTATRTSTPSATPTATPTPSATNTPSPSPTRTPSNTPTATPSATNTPTPTNTPTVTPTRTATNTPTNTPPPTNTRPPIPVVPSPMSPAGMLMIGALGVGLLWALRRISAVR